MNKKTKKEDTSSVNEGESAKASTLKEDRSEPVTMSPKFTKQPRLANPP